MASKIGEALVVNVNGNIRADRTVHGSLKTDSQIDQVCTLGAKERPFRVSFFISRRD